MIIEVFTSPGCSKCKHITRMIMDLLKDLPEEVTLREINVLDELEYATRLGVYTTPTIALDGKLVFRGVPTRKQIVQFVQKIRSGEIEWK